jgi:Group II intron, maturase-specific domain
VVLCATREQAEQARELVAAVLDGLGLRLHPEKTRTAHLARGAERFTFLGFEHRMRESWRQPGRWYQQKWPSQRAVASIRGKIRARTERRYARLPLEWAVEDLNRALRGWGNYFRYGNSGRKFAQIYFYVNERPAILASAKHGLQGRNWVTRFNYEWSTRRRRRTDTPAFARRNRSKASAFVGCASAKLGAQELSDAYCGSWLSIQRSSAGPLSTLTMTA